ncbi:MAG: hypothetical protein ACMG6S_22055 [Byssovorax sp.]
MSEYEGRCGGCGAFTRVRTDPTLGRVGECALQVFPPPIRAASTCTRYRPKGAPAPPPPARVAGEPRGRRATSPSPVRSVGGPGHSGSSGQPVQRRVSLLPQEIDIDMDIGEFRRVLREVLADELGVGDAEIGGRWEGGEMVLKPGKAGTQEKRIPLDALFHKIVMIRDKLRLLEQKVNAHPGLSDADKVQLQQYVTGCYGSLTTFNALFARRDEGFAGAGKDDD